MLTALQASVETAEASWTKKYEEAVSGKSATQTEMASLKTKNSELQGELAALKLVEKEVDRLRQQLEGEMTSKQELAVRCTELQQLLTLAQQDRAQHKTQEVCQPLANGNSEQAGCEANPLASPGCEDEASLTSLDSSVSEPPSSEAKKKKSKKSKVPTGPCRSYRAVFGRK
jgi:Flp pilus assembly protein TadD